MPVLSAGGLLLMAGPLLCSVTLLKLCILYSTYSFWVLDVIGTVLLWLGTIGRKRDIVVFSDSVFLS